MSSEAGESLILPEGVEKLLERIKKLCSKIPVAKKETSQLAELCDTISDRLSDGSLIPQQPNYNGIKSDLVGVEEKLKDWSKLGIVSIVESFWNKEDIEAGVIGFVKKLEVRIQGIQSAQADKAPPINRLDGEVTRLHATSFAKGKYCEVWVGEWENGGGDKVKVALKALRTESPEARKALERELPRWKDLHHQNILPFYGIVTDIAPHFYMVSLWQEKGNLLNYLKTTPQPNKKYLLRGAAAGLNYLHSRDVVHGSVSCKNVLVSDEGEPQICDFGITRIWEGINGAPTSRTLSAGGYVRYMAPELIEDSDVPATTHSDAYSFAMLILECITGQVPFSDISHDYRVLLAKTTKKQFPPRPDGPEWKNHAPEGLWELMRRCWLAKPEERPTMEHVHGFFLHRA